ncbi:MAG: DPP IV N-terminal domain-containing protein [Bacteroidetes bacterium]|nr:DPP IV N-terminal domain-containing protein [Bacteroidota bacterium]
MKKITLVLVLFIGVNFSYGQEPGMLTLEDAVLNTNLYPKGLPNLSFLPSGDYFAYSKNETKKLYIEKIDKLQTDSSITLERLNAAMELAKENKLASIPLIKWVSDNTLEFSSGKKVFRYNRESNTVITINEIPQDAENPEWNKDKSLLAFTKDYNLFLKKDGKVEALTEDGHYGVVYGTAVHRNEFGINKGLFWSNDGKKLAFYRMDESAVTDYQTYQNSDRPATMHKFKYPMAGTTSHSVKVGIYDTEKGTLRYLKVEGPYDQYLTNITWSPDDKYIYIAKVSRNQKNMWLERYWADDGNLDMIVLNEFNEKYVEPQNGPLFLPWDNEQFIWQSQKDGYNHLYLYKTTGKLVRQLSKGPWVVTDILGFSEETQHVFIEGTKDGALERHVYAIAIANAKIRKITNEKGSHSVLVNKNGTFFLDAYSSITVPRNIDLLSETGAMLRNIFTAENPLKDYQLGETSIFPLQNGNTTLYARMIKPVNFDENKSYPVIVYVYGGPHVQLVRNSWLGASNLWMQFLAQQGFIVFTLDNRGSANRGFEFESAIYGQLGTKEIEDQMIGIEYLKKLPYVDASRIGVHGWSFGGFMTTSLMTRTPGVFKVGVAGGPVIDWRMYEIMYTERYMGNPKDNPDGYDKANLLNYADKLEGKLLMIHGCDDDVVLWQHSLLYVDKCVKNNNTLLDYFVYPGHKHNVYGKDRLHLMTKITEYLFENL